MNDVLPTRTRWDRLLLGLVLVLQVVTLGLLTWVILDRQERESTMANLRESAPVVSSRLLPATLHLQQEGDLIDDMNRAMQAMSQFPDMSSFLEWENHWNELRASPTMDIRELGDRCIVSVRMPGVKAEDVDVSLEGNLLSVSASARVRQGGGERFETFERKVRVPSQVGNPDLVQAVLSNDVLQVVLPYGNPPALSASSSSRRLL